MYKSFARGALVALFTLISFGVHAQAIKTNIAAPVSLYYEHPISDAVSVQAGAAYDLIGAAIFRTILGASDLNNGTFRYTGLSFPVEARYYFSEEVGDGFFALGFAKYRSATASAEFDYFNSVNGSIRTFRDKLNFSAVGIGGGFGFQKRIEEGLLFEVSTGLGYSVLNTLTTTELELNTSGDFEEVKESEVYGGLGVMVRFGLTVGYVIGD